MLFFQFNANNAQFLAWWNWYREHGTVSWVLSTTERISKHRKQYGKLLHGQASWLRYWFRLWRKTFSLQSFAAIPNEWSSVFYQWIIIHRYIHLQEQKYCSSIYFEIPKKSNQTKIDSKTNNKLIFPRIRVNFDILDN